MILYLQNKLSKPPANKQEYGPGVGDKSCRIKLTYHKHHSRYMKWESGWGTWSVAILETICCWYWIFRCRNWPWFEGVRIVCSIFWMLSHIKAPAQGFFAWEIVGWLGASLHFAVLPQLAAIHGVSAALICCKVMWQHRCSIMHP